MNPKFCVIFNTIQPKLAAPLPGAQRGTKGTVLFVPLRTGPQTAFIKKKEGHKKNRPLCAPLFPLCRAETQVILQSFPLLQVGVQRNRSRRT